MHTLQARRHTDVRAYPGASVVLHPQALTADVRGYALHSDVCAVDRESVPIPGTFRGERPVTAPLPSGRIHLPAGFLFFANPWTVNYQHFFVELFPKLVDYLVVRARSRDPVPLLVPASCDNLLSRELFELFGVSRDVTILEPEGAWEVGTLYSSGFIPDYGGVGPKLVLAFRMLRERLGLHRRLGASTRRLYLARDPAPGANLERNDNAAGASRVIVNHDEVLKALGEHGFETVTLGANSLKEKVARIAGASVVVSPLGANLINCLFLSRPFPRTIVILHSDAYANHAYMETLINRVLGARIRFRFVPGVASDPVAVNSPYVLDMDALAGVIRKYAPAPSGRRTG